MRQNCHDLISSSALLCLAIPDLNSGAKVHNKLLALQYVEYCSSLRLVSMFLLCSWMHFIMNLSLASSCSTGKSALKVARSSRTNKYMLDLEFSRK